jgi:hypothetical protein
MDSEIDMRLRCEQKHLHHIQVLGERSLAGGNEPQLRWVTAEFQKRLRYEQEHSTQTDNTCC